MSLVSEFFCSGCARLIPDGEQIEIETRCRLVFCDHKDPEACAKGFVYVHRNEDCFEAAVQVVRKGK